MSSLDTVFHSKLDSTVKGIVEKWFEDYKDIPEGYSSDFYYNHMSNRKNSNLGIPRLGEIIGNFKCVGKRSPWVDHNSGRGYQTSVSCLLAPASEAEIEADKKKKAKKVAQANKKAEEERQKMLEASQPLMDAPDKKELQNFLSARFSQSLNMPRMEACFYIS